MNHLEFGEKGEQIAAEFLQEQGYRLIARRYRTKIGEIDIIVERDGMIVFVEVKTRRNTLFGTPAEAVNRRKQDKIIHTALYYLNYTRNNNRPFRFDILEVKISAEGMTVCNHIINAFGR
jgi:putative endonuclease